MKENRKGRYGKEEQEVKEKRKGEGKERKEERKGEGKERKEERKEEGKERKVLQIIYWKFNNKCLKTIL
ncbi:hypothetical protein MSBR3_0019 [Methanosarcina barkeri 3]|uniref:Uncharacterized protein n=1 Tax=Methanosarcina barkeri 3 TaxID=1434107 RepID=A0A0E3SJ43_METBA|nr:hypothetical protein [Methanosarcina barkeri]AKB80597.1 hypothetical protein MSBR3_0019 [Methanosarcina barkeri 3]